MTDPSAELKSLGKQLSGQLRSMAINDMFNRIDFAMGSIAMAYVRAGLCQCCLGCFFFKRPPCRLGQWGIASLNVQVAMQHLIGSFVQLAMFAIAGGAS